MAWPKKSGLRLCRLCGGRFNPIDWANHHHLSEEEILEEQRKLREWKERNPTPRRPEAEVFKGFREGED
jgi:hypothetical protein